ncbi:MAG TPA: hypothetical protein VGI76_05655 [Solirubrobacteraceae bacterium]|jgi:hypothetical protein
MTTSTNKPLPPDPLSPATTPDEHAIGDAELESGELPPRPRRRLLGAGGNPVQIALLGVLVTASGFIGGVLVEKGQASTNSTAGGGLASGLAAGLTASRGPTARGGLLGRRAGAGATIGEVTYISGNTLYVSDFEGNTVKVKTSAASAITKTVKARVHDIRPGETVIVRGTKDARGAVNAESVSVGGAAGGTLGTLFGGAGGARGGGARGEASGGGGPAGESILFGK